MPKVPKGERYQLMIIHGLVEPSLYGRSTSDWKILETTIIEVLKRDDHDDSEDGLFFLKLNKDGRLKSACSFSNNFMDEMRVKAGLPAL